MGQGQPQFSHWIFKHSSQDNRAFFFGKKKGFQRWCCKVLWYQQIHKGSSIFHSNSENMKISLWGGTLHQRERYPKLSWLHYGWCVRGNPGQSPPAAEAFSLCCGHWPYLPYSAIQSLCLCCRQRMPLLYFPVRIFGSPPWPQLQVPLPFLLWVQRNRAASFLWTCCHHFLCDTWLLLAAASHVHDWMNQWTGTQIQPGLVLTIVVARGANTLLTMASPLVRARENLGSWSFFVSCAVQSIDR